MDADEEGVSKFPIRVHPTYLRFVLRRSENLATNFRFSTRY